ncbi:MAG: gliding motility-associated-like protein [Arenicella sp.]|jgi:gliding motility-associated-like protein
MTLFRYISFLLLLLPSVINAQNTGTYWYFNDSLGLRFNESSFSLVGDGVTQTREGTSVICESDSLLLYTDGVTVWDNAHNAIENGTDLNGNQSSIQSSIILRQPESQIFHIITVDASGAENVLDNKGICYSVVVYDPVLQKFTLTSKNISLGVLGNEAITAKKSASFDGFWIIFPEYNTKNIHIYKLDKDGLSFHSKQLVLPHNHIGKSQIKISPNGNYLSLMTLGYGGLYNICIYNFDNFTGTLSTYGSISNFVSHGIEFSTNEKFLYIHGYSTRSFTDNVQPGTYQVTIDSVKPNTTLSSVNSTFLHTASAAAVLSLTPNGQIFITSYYGGKGFSAILQPDSFGLMCDFRPDYIHFNNRPENSSIPNICIDYILQPYFEIESGCIDSTMTLRLIRNRADSVTWNFGDGYSITNTLDSSNHIFQNNGKYNVSAISHYSTHLDTITKEIEIFTIEKPNLGKDTLLCFGEELIFNITDTLSTLVVWQNTDTSVRYNVSEPQTVFVKSSNEYCNAFDTVSVNYINCGIVIDSLCFGDSTIFRLSDLSLDSALFSFGDGIQISTTSSEVKHEYPSGGDYNTAVTMSVNGLSKIIKDTIIITSIEENFLVDSIIECETIQLSPTLSQYDYDYIWNTGQATRELEVQKTGIYTLKIAKNGCSAVDSCLVTIEDCHCPFFIPTSFTPNGDNLNDSFTLFTECDLDEISMNIYNRWGEQIFKNSDSWDGKYQGLTCPNGVYLWTISFKDKNNQTQYEKGTVYLVR